MARQADVGGVASGNARHEVSCNHLSLLSFTVTHELHAEAVEGGVRVDGAVEEDLYVRHRYDVCFRTVDDGRNCNKDIIQMI